jgi:hypothetical protein
VNDLCKQKGVPAEDVGDYADRVAKSINGNKAILARIEAGNFVDVQNFLPRFTTPKSPRLQRWTKAQTAAANRRIEIRGFLLAGHHLHRRAQRNRST